MKLDINSTISVITSSTNEKRLTQQIKKQDQICCLQEAHFKYKDTYILKAKEWRKIYHANTEQSWSSYINFRQNKLKSKENYQR